MLVKTYGSAVYGVDAQLITIEVSSGGNVGQGLPGYVLIGLPDNAVREGYHRVYTALKTVGLRIPRIKITINMAPADVRKEGASYDLTLAVGILASTEQISAEDIGQYIIMGELSLDGSLRPIKGALPIAIKAREDGFKGVILPIENAKEAAIVNDLEVLGVENIEEVIQFFLGDSDIKPTTVDTRHEFAQTLKDYDVDFSDVKGQESIKRALEIAAAGGHNVILIGPPGAGKTMLAKRLSSILPPLSLNEALETTKIYSVAGNLPENTALIATRPFRSPHHTISDVALVGGGSNPQPGEISLAHNGVLFLDELPEYKRQVLEVMRQPMEEGKVTISRARLSVDYEARFVLIAACNPCPCGYYNHPSKECLCGPGIVKKYLNKISGPLLDRIDLHVEVTPVSYEELHTSKKEVTSETIRNRVIKARSIQEKRFENSPAHCNAQMTGRQISEICNINKDCRALLKSAMEKLQLSARAYDRILKVARTIADLDNSVTIETFHLTEAIHFRSLDREGWAG